MSFSPCVRHASPEVQTVVAWHDALNAGDVEHLVGLSHPDVAVGGPRGTAQGANVLREWVDRANIHLEPGRIFHEDDIVVVEQAAAWTSADTGETTPAQTVASAFMVRDGVVTTVVRYPNLAEALLASDLDQSQETRPE
jgi:ketosteroid isomerase-like protein